MYTLSYKYHMKKSKYLKIITHVPENYLAQVQKAIWDAGAGREWNYSYCSFAIKWTGFFTPLEWASPAIWELEKPEKVVEYHLEFTCHKDLLEKVIWELKEVHPYEEVPIQIFEYFEI